VSFRLRVLALVALVAVTAVGATAYLAYRQTARQVQETAAADQQTVAHIADSVADYGRRHGTWEGVPGTVHQLSIGTRQRIKLITDGGIVVVDTDTLDRRTARAVTGPPTLVDARPTLTLSSPDGNIPPTEITLDAITKYRAGVRFAACLTRNGYAVKVSTGPDGIPVYSADGNLAVDAPDLVDRCTPIHPKSEIDSATTQVKLCADALWPVIVDCLRKVFAEQTADLAPVPLLIYVGATGQARPALSPGPVIAAAALVALLAIAGTAVLSRRVLRPIGALTAASERLGQGDLTLRVPADGRDELAQLARSFNRMADSLQRGEERQRRLVADVAHELRTPLANLRGYLEALADGVVPATPELFASLHEEAVLQQRIVDDLQDLALAEAGVLAYNTTQIDLTELLETCKTAHQAAADAAGVALLVRADGPVPVPADPDRLRQVVGNLVANALRATPAGGSVTLSATGPADGIATVVVRDTGAGIAAADLPRVFDRFWRPDAARGRTTGGSGLGLAIARQIVTDHGGRIEVDSEVGMGTEVTITLPAG
jgi:two-component system, OmpR family, sensor histidine kinase BaeS